MHQKRRRKFAFALVVCLLFGLLPGASRAEQTQTTPVADAQEAETPPDAVPAAQTPTELTEAETVSLSQDEVRVIKGGTTTLTAEIPEAERGESPLTTAPNIVWSSSNPAVATVDSNGVVTGIELGEATITATLNGTVIETFTVYSTLGDGYYVIGTLDYERYICTDELSVGNYVSMYALPMSAFEEDSTGLDEEIGRKWYIDYLGEGFYIIYPAYCSSMALSYLDVMLTMVCPIGTTSTYARHWKITSGTIDYVIQNRADSSVYLEFTDPEEDYASLDCAFYDSPSEAQNWCINSTLEPSGLLLFDKHSGNLVANSFDTPTTTHTAYIETSISRTLGQIGLYVQVLDPSSQLVDYEIDIDSPLVTYNPYTTRLIANSPVLTTLEITKSIYGLQHSVSCNLYAYNSTETVSVYYDLAYKNRHGTSSTPVRINNILQRVKQKFVDSYNIVLTFSTPTMFSSYGDSCTSNYLGNCSCESNSFGTTCTNAYSSIDPDGNPVHHKNAYNILHTSPYSNTTKRLNFIGHYTCFLPSYSGIGQIPHIISGTYSQNGKLQYLFGLANIEKNLVQVHDHISVDHEVATIVHELGHLYGAPDHYSGAANGWTVDQLNELDVVDGQYLFSNVCLYGDEAYDSNNANVNNNLTVCSGCTKVIRGELEIPEKPPENNSGV